MLELVEARNKVASTIFFSQCDTSEWHENLYDPPLADAICDRIICNAYTIQIEGESRRKGKGIPEQFSAWRPDAPSSAVKLHFLSGVRNPTVMILNNKLNIQVKFYVPAEKNGLTAQKVTQL